MGFREMCLYRKHFYILTQREEKEERGIHLTPQKREKENRRKCQDETVQFGQGGTMLENNSIPATQLYLPLSS